MDFINVLLLLAGLGVYLYGLELISNKLGSICGLKLRQLMVFTAHNKTITHMLGFLCTLFIGNPLAENLLTIRFYNSRIVLMPHTVWMMLGTTIGTAIISQLAAFRLVFYAPVLLVVMIMIVAAITLIMNVQWIVQVSEFVIGVSLLFVGLELASSAAALLSADVLFIGTITLLRNPIIGLLVGAILSSKLHCSDFVVGILLALSASSMLPLESAVFLLLGSMMGPGIAEFILSVGTNVEHKQFALTNLLYGLLSAGCASIVVLLVPSSLDLIKALSTNDWCRQIAYVCTVFCLFRIGLFFPLAHSMITISRLIVRPHPHQSNKRMLPLNRACSKASTISTFNKSERPTI